MGKKKTMDSRLRGNDIIKIAEDLLEKIGEATFEIDSKMHDMGVEIEAVKTKYQAHINEWKNNLADTEKDLIALMKKNKRVLFDAADQVDLDNGVLLYSKKLHTKIPKNAVEAIDAQGWEDGLKRTVAVDREVVSAWPVEKLTVIGAERTEKEVFDYEVNR
ncbi:MAG: host-nuclease inhibitor Gam family protein [Patescibacteria group bacterium]|jgi:hypothetical protein